MINHISIKNFAIIENTEVDFEDGLNIITGETGSGKSIVIEAISLALGSRADTSAIRTGADKAIVQLLGSLNGEEILITREVSSSGKNLCKLNGEIVTLAQLNQVCTRLADIHGQYDNQSLLNPEYHQVLVDTYKTDLTAPIKSQVADIFEKFSSCRSRLASLLSAERENARKKDFYQYEVAEIDKAAIVPGEDTELANRISLLQNSEKIFENVEKAYALMSGDTSSVLDTMSVAVRSVEDISQFSRELDVLSQEFSDIYYRLQDLCGELREIRDGITFSPSELDAAISRLNLIDNLKKKYGSSIEEILEYRENIAAQLGVIENFDDIKLNLEKELVLLKKDLLCACDALTKARRQVADELETKIRQELIDLNFHDSQISISIEPLSTPTAEGMDKVEILISTNKGQPLKPLYKIASGGEMSRIMLAFKNIISAYDMIPTLIFDEIDNGISGITASIVGQKLREISRERQILCITHLPQIAACGDHHYRIYKESDDHTTFTTVEPLNEEEKVSEIARLLGGANITETTMQSARELIDGSIC
ncbi:MAG: DNA repair protein RecN [Firmicutes bacterium]|nr:DNA repair protein RecN [Bacillota bacterium]